jgi:hypothetical protein
MRPCLKKVYMIKLARLTVKEVHSEIATCGLYWGRFYPKVIIRENDPYQPLVVLS